jgi:ADP-ribose pyrophosphatase YjhB (NUDIX family)
MSLWRGALARTVRVGLPLVARLTRPLTMGVRALILDQEGRVCLLRHTYVPGWHMPGGAIEPHETAEAALRREVLEETGLEIGPDRPVLFGLYLNEVMARRDHIALYIVRDARQTARRPPPLEISEVGFFSLSDLPPDVTGPTRRRLAEALEGRPPEPLW